MGFSEPEGRLYEYLEGTLMRGVGGSRSLPREVAFYDLSKVGEWEDLGEGSADMVVDEVIDETDGQGINKDEEKDGVRRTKRFGFEVAEFAVDPGMDLLVLVEVR